MKQTLSKATRILLAPALVFGLAATPALANDAMPQKAAPEARIPFANHGGIRDWRPGEDKRTLYVQSRSRDWYKATLMTDAFDLPFALAIGFDAHPIGTFDRFSNVIVDGRRYAVQSLIKIEGNPPSRHAAKQSQARA